MTRVGINGLGRIGRLLARRISERVDTREALTIAAANELADPQTVAHLLKYDSTHGRFGLRVDVGRGAIKIDGHSIPLMNYSSAEHDFWHAQAVDLVIDCTGGELDRAVASQHLRGSV